jgi:hypothetical protein
MYKRGIQLDLFKSAGTKSGLTEYHVLEDGIPIAVLFHPASAHEFRHEMIKHADGQEYEVREVLPWPPLCSA